MGLVEDLHNEKLWLLQQPVVIPSLFEKRMQKIYRLVYGSNENINNSYLKPELEVVITNSKKGNLFHFLENYDANLNKLKQAFMSAEEVDVVCSVLSQMIDLEWQYFEQIEVFYNLEDIEEGDISSRDKLPAYRFASLLKSGGTADTPEILREIQRVKKLIRLHRKSR